MFLIEYQGLPIAHHQPVSIPMHSEVPYNAENVEERKKIMVEGTEQRVGRRR